MKNIWIYQDCFVSLHCDLRMKEQTLSALWTPRPRYNTVIHERKNKKSPAGCSRNAEGDVSGGEERGAQRTEPGQGVPMFEGGGKRGVCGAGTERGATRHE